MSILFFPLIIFGLCLQKVIKRFTIDQVVLVKIVNQFDEEHAENDVRLKLCNILTNCDETEFL